MITENKSGVITKIIITVLLIAAALAVDKSSTLGWGGCWAQDSTRYKISPVGISHVLNPRSYISATVDAKWIPESGAASLRAVIPGGEDSFNNLKLTYPILKISFWLLLVSVIILWLPIRKINYKIIFSATASLVSVAVLLGILFFAANIKKSLAVVYNSDIAFGGTLGVMLISTVPFLCLLTVVLFFARKYFIYFVILFSALWYYYVMYIGSMSEFNMIIFLFLPVLITVVTAAVKIRKNQESKVSIL